MGEVLERRGYYNLEKFDSGGQANVYRVTKDGNVYAIKVSEISPKNQQTLEEDMKRELTIINQVDHPNCITVTDMFRTKKRLYIVMPFMPNGTIGSKVRKNGKGLDEWEIRFWFPPIVRAIKYLHDKSIAHRDLKLDNILLDANDNPMVADYGFALFVTRDASGAINPNKSWCGTPSHMPPEMLKKQLYNSFGVDIWCLGIMLFIMANFDYPFDKRLEEHVRCQIQMRRQYQLRESTLKRITTTLKDLIDKLLEPVPSKRLTCAQICLHPWFPIIYREGDILLAKALERESKSSGASQ